MSANSHALISSKFGALLLLVTNGSLFAQTAVIDQPAFSAAPGALRDAFQSLKAGTNDVTVLYEEASYDIDSGGGVLYRLRRIFKVWTKDGAEESAMVRRTYAPWQEDRPIVRARVIGAEGAAHELDPKTIADSPAHESDDDVLTDRRVIKAPLPAMEAGAIVEEEVVTRQTKPSLSAGIVRYYYFGGSEPFERTRLTIRVPASMPLKYKTRLLPDLKIKDQTENGIRVLAFDQGPLAADQEFIPFLASDAPRSPRIVFSTAKDWNSLSAEYTAIVEKQLAGFSAARYLPKFPTGAGREEKALAIVRQLNREIRYTGLEFAEGSLVPRQPAEVIAQKYGDCKDKSTLAVALLRAAGIEAHVALLLSSQGEDIEPELPESTSPTTPLSMRPGRPIYGSIPRTQICGCMWFRPITRDALPSSRASSVVPDAGQWRCGPIGCDFPSDRRFRKGR